MKNECFPFEDPNLPLDQRIIDLLDRLTIEEKCSLLSHDSPEIKRLNIPAYNWWNEALHGIGRNGRATIFPQPIGLAATWDPDQIFQIASSIAEEARAKFNEAQRNGKKGQYQGLTFWTPNINLFRDGRWGRGMETWGEDPYLTGEMGAAFVRGLQGEEPGVLKAAACAKHFAVHSGPEKLRHSFDVHPSKNDFWNFYLPAFRRLVEAGVEAVMPAYNRVYGEPCAGSDFLLQKILRDQWGFEGHVVSDCWGIRDFHREHKVTENAEESAALALKSGTDLNCGSIYCNCLLNAYELRLVDEDDINRSLRRLLKTRFRLGLFNPPKEQPYTSIPMEVVRSKKHLNLSFEAAIESFVLLKNKDNALPISEEASSLLIIGPNASNIDVMLGNYFGLSDDVSTVLEGITKRLPEGMEIDYRMGCLHDTPVRNPVDWVSFEATRRDYVIAAMGLSPMMEGEEGDAIMADDTGDRSKLELPESQLELLRKVRTRITEEGSETKLVVLLFGGSPIACPELHSLADAILLVWYPGDRGGDAIASVLWGDANPGGRLPFTVPISTDVLPPFEDYSLEHRGYQGMQPEHVLYPFGYGLSFAKTNILSIDVPKKHVSGTSLEIEIHLKNLSERNASEVIQIFISNYNKKPRLLSFLKIHFAPKEKKTVKLKVDGESFRIHDDFGMRQLIKGEWDIHIGSGAIPLSSMDLPRNSIFSKALELL